MQTRHFRICWVCFYSTQIQHTNRTFSMYRRFTCFLSQTYASANETVQVALSVSHIFCSWLMYRRQTRHFKIYQVLHILFILDRSITYKRDTSRCIGRFKYFFVLGRNIKHEQNILGYIKRFGCYFVLALDLNTSNLVKIGRSLPSINQIFFLTH